MEQIVITDSVKVSSICDLVFSFCVASKFTLMKSMLNSFGFIVDVVNQWGRPKGSSVTSTVYCIYS